MKSILFVINSLTTGGAERQVINDANLLNSNGFDVTIAFCGEGVLRNLVNDNIDLYPLKSVNIFRAITQLTMLLFKMRFDFVFGHMYWGLKVTAIPCFITNHKLVFFEHGLGLWRKFYHITIIKFLETFVQNIVVVSNKKKEVKINKERTSNSKLSVIPNSFQMKEFNKIEQFEKIDNIVKIIFVGRFNPVKQLIFLPEIANILLEKDIVNFQFILCGTGQDEQKISSKVIEYKLSDYFVLTGYVDNPFQYLLQSDINVLPSRTEDLSVALLEAGYAGLPMVVFDVGGNSDIVVNNKTGYLIKPFNLDEFADKLEILIKQPELRNKIGNQAHEFIKSNFTEGHRLKRLIEMMKSI